MKHFGIEDSNDYGMTNNLDQNLFTISSLTATTCGTLPRKKQWLNM